MAADTPLLIATRIPSGYHQRVAVAVAMALFVFFLSALPFANVPLARINAVIPVVSTLMALGDCISAVLLFGQFAVLRSRALLVLAGGYLFTGLVVIPYALTFPGAFSEMGLLGANLQTAALLFVAWHTGLPAAAIAYALMRDTRRPELGPVAMPVPTAIAMTAAIAFVLALASTWLAIHHADLFPRVAASATQLTPPAWPTFTAMVLSIAAVILLLARQRSILDLWLLVVCFAWLLDSVLTYVTQERYSGTWYANRVIRVVAANLVLFILLAETTRLYAGITSSVLAQRRERDRRTMTMDALSSALEHELRQPLGAISANASAAQIGLERIPPQVEPAREAVAAINQDVVRANELLRSLRRLSTSRERKPEQLDPNQLVRETLALTRHELENLHIAVRLELAEGLPSLPGDRRQLQEVLLNLVLNAADAMRECDPGTAMLRIGTERLADQRIGFSVSDNGCGIVEEARERVFEPFYTTKPNGTGMGLALCRSIVERHGGEVSAAGAQPRGSVLRVILPSA